MTFGDVLKQINYEFQLQVFFCSDRVEFSSFPSGLRLSLHPCSHSRGRRVPLRRQRIIAANALHAGIEVDHVEGEPL